MQWKFNQIESSSNKISFDKMSFGKCIQPTIDIFRIAFASAHDTLWKVMLNE